MFFLFFLLVMLFYTDGVRSITILAIVMNMYRIFVWLRTSAIFE